MMYCPPPRRDSFPNEEDYNSALASYRNAQNWNMAAILVMVCGLLFGCITPMLYLIYQMHGAQGLWTVGIGLSCFAVVTYAVKRLLDRIDGERS